MLNKYINISIISGIVLFLSSQVFLYDEEKIVALCLISFAVIAYFNFSEVIYQSLAEKGQILELEFLNLYKTKIEITRKLRSYWRIFLDLEDQLIEIYCWINTRLTSIINIYQKNRSLLYHYIIKDNLNGLLINKINTKKSLNKKILKNGFLLDFEKSIIYISKSLNILKNLKKIDSLINLVLVKLNLTKTQVINSKNYLFASYLKLRINNFG